MNAMSFLLATLLLSASAQAAQPVVLADLSAPDSARNWISVNDGVMGGVSKGGFTRTAAGTLLFKGDLSLENNGGFASIRTRPSALGIAGRPDIAVRARGDGRTYWIELRVDNQMGASSYRAFLPTRKDEWTETRIPLKDFKLQAFGREIPGPALDPAQADSIGFTLADKKAGPFSLEIEWVRALKGGTPSAAAKPAGDGGGTLVDLATSAGRFKTLLAAAQAAGLAEALSGPGPFTVLAPTDEAFAGLPAGALEDLLKPENKERLAAILKYHVIAGRVPLAKALEARERVTLEGSRITAAFKDGDVRVGPARLLQADLEAANGILHVIDQVLLPPEKNADPLTARALIKLAIERGVPLFNDGNPDGCAAVYEITCESLRAMEAVPRKTCQDLEKALREASAEKQAREKAWILRRALDRAFRSLPANP